MEISVVLYDRFTALDCMGPYEVPVGKSYLEAFHRGLRNL